ncbi:hypothetical protein DXG03_006492 [Asterophora parasitica]|uniref:SigF-like NTF2-like domain-containing protein n=1 Tax=Asterophora parasitica TaxID=117018 RepID=A0A9P7GAR9_9AGAR|nr:hypothetical protein DXG03_006492 [Asterophora parasitica]
MQNPESEIKTVLRRLLTSSSPDAQRDSLFQYFAEDVGYRSPFFKIAPGPLSREDVLGVYHQVYDEHSHVIILETTQLFRVRFSPFNATPAKYLTRFKLKKAGTKYVIASQEDFYHPDDLMNLVLPPLAPLVRFALSIISYGSAFAAKSAQVMGYWRVGASEESHGSEFRMGGHPMKEDASQGGGEFRSTGHGKHPTGREGKRSKKQP